MLKLEAHEIPTLPPLSKLIRLSAGQGCDNKEREKEDKVTAAADRGEKKLASVSTKDEEGPLLAGVPVNAPDMLRRGYDDLIINRTTVAS